MKKLITIILLSFTVLSCATVQGKPSSSQEEVFFEKKQAALESILGPFHDLVSHSIVPFSIGGSLDLYFINLKDKTALLTMELINHSGSVSLESRIGTYEFIAFTKHHVDPDSKEFISITNRMTSVFTTLGYYSMEAVLNPYETAEVPMDSGKNVCLVFDEYPTDGRFDIDGQKHGLLLIIEVFEDEMRYAMRYGTKQLIKLLKEKGFYPMSDLDRKSVLSK